MSLYPVRWASFMYIIPEVLEHHDQKDISGSAQDEYKMIDPNFRFHVLLFASGCDKQHRTLHIWQQITQYFGKQKVFLIVFADELITSLGMATIFLLSASSLKVELWDLHRCPVKLVGDVTDCYFCFCSLMLILILSSSAVIFFGWPVWYLVAQCTSDFFLIRDIPGCCFGYLQWALMPLIIFFSQDFQSKVNIQSY